MAGPGLAGLLVDAITAPYAIAVDGVSFAWSALLVARIRQREQPPERVEARNMRREVAEGLRYPLGDPRWRAITFYVATFNIGTSVAFSIFVVYAVRSLHLSPAQLGLVFMLGNLGWLGRAIVARLRPLRRGADNRVRRRAGRPAAPPRPARPALVPDPLPRRSAFSSSSRSRSARSASSPRVP